LYIYNFSPRFTRFWPPARLGDPSSVSLTDTDLDVLDNMQVNQLGEEYHLGKPVSEDQGFRLINDIREKGEYTCSGHVPAWRRDTTHR